MEQGKKKKKKNSPATACITQWIGLVNQLSVMLANIDREYI